MFLNDLSNKNRRFTKVNRWLNKEFGVTINENSTIDQTVQKILDYLDKNKLMKNTKKM